MDTNSLSPDSVDKLQWMDRDGKVLDHQAPYAYRIVRRHILKRLYKYSTPVDPDQSPGLVECDISAGVVLAAILSGADLPEIMPHLAKWGRYRLPKDDEDDEDGEDGEQTLEDPLHTAIDASFHAYQEFLTERIADYKHESFGSWHGRPHDRNALLEPHVDHEWVECRWDIAMTTLKFPAKKSRERREREVECHLTRPRKSSEDKDAYGRPFLYSGSLPQLGISKDIRNREWNFNPTASNEEPTKYGNTGADTEPGYLYEKGLVGKRVLLHLEREYHAAGCVCYRSVSPLGTVIWPDSFKTVVKHVGDCLHYDRSVVFIDPSTNRHTVEYHEDYRIVVYNRDDGPKELVYYQHYKNFQQLKWFRQSVDRIWRMFVVKLTCKVRERAEVRLRTHLPGGAQHTAALRAWTRANRVEPADPDESAESDDSADSAGPSKRQKKESDEVEVNHCNQWLNMHHDLYDCGNLTTEDRDALLNRYKQQFRIFVEQQREMNDRFHRQDMDRLGRMCNNNNPLLAPIDLLARINDFVRATLNKRSAGFSPTSDEERAIEESDGNDDKPNQSLELNDDDYYEDTTDGYTVITKRLNESGQRKSRAFEAWKLAEQLMGREGNGREGNMTHKTNIFKALLKAHATDDHAKEIAEKIKYDIGQNLENLASLSDLADQTGEIATNLTSLADMAEKTGDLADKIGEVSDYMQDK